MEYQGAESRGRLFFSCIKERHHSRESTLSQHAVVHVFAGELRIVHANEEGIFTAGDTVLIPRNQLGRMYKTPSHDGPFRSVSILFPEDMLRKYYAIHPVSAQPWIAHIPISRHPLLQSLFNSLEPYFNLHNDELPPDITDMKIQEALTILDTCNKQISQVLGYFEEPGKIDLADFMEQNYMYNLPLEKFGYLTGRSLSTFKKDFKKVFKVTPGRWLTRKRLELAHYQIFEKKKKPSDVYVDVGFENLSHFSYAFKKEFGYNPTSSV